MSCLPPPEPPGPGVAPGVRTVTAQNFAAEGAEVRLDDACVPRGVEQCFNATDDDCNGLVDEGCGLPDGDVLLAAAWDDNPADLDWVLYLPGDQKLTAAKKQSGPFRYASNCPSGCAGQNIEAIVASGGAPAKGAYRAELRLRAPAGELPVRVRFAARFGSRVEQGEAALSLAHDALVLTFSL